MKQIIVIIFLFLLPNFLISQIVTEPKEFSIDIKGDNCTVRVNGKFYVSSYAGGTLILGWTEKEVLSYTNKKGKQFTNILYDTKIDVGNPSAWLTLHLDNTEIHFRVMQMLKWSGSGSGNAFDAVSKDYYLFENARYGREFAKEEFEYAQSWFISRLTSGDQDIHCDCQEYEDYFDYKEFWELVEKGDEALEKKNSAVAIKFYNQAKLLAENDPDKTIYDHVDHVKIAQNRIEEAISKDLEAEEKERSQKEQKNENSNDKSSNSDTSLINYYVQLKISGDAALARFDYDEALRYYQQAKALGVILDTREIDSKINQAKKGQFGNAVASLADADVGEGKYNGHFMFGTFIGGLGLENQRVIGSESMELTTIPFHSELYGRLRFTKFISLNIGGEYTLPIAFPFDGIYTNESLDGSAFMASVSGGLNILDVVSFFYTYNWDQVEAEYQSDGRNTVLGSESAMNSNGYGVAIGWTKAKKFFLQLKYQATLANELGLLNSTQIGLDVGRNMIHLKGFYRSLEIDDGQSEAVNVKIWGILLGFRVVY